MLDTRLIGRDEQLNYANYFNADGSFDTASFAAAWQNPERTILGASQKVWLQGQLAGGTAAWQVLGSQVLMGKMTIPAELLAITAQLASGGGDTAALLSAYNDQLTELAIIKTRVLQGDPTVAPEEQARVETVLPYNLDAWDGYPVEREAVFAAASGKKLVSLAGDTHNAWHSNLTDINGNKVGTEIATASVSSPGLEAVFGSDPAVVAGFEQVNQLLIDDLNYVDASQRGYLLAEFTASGASAEWRFIGTLFAEDTSVNVGNQADIV